MTSTVKKFIDSGLNNKVDLLRVLVLSDINLHEYREPLEYNLLNGHVFSLKNDVLNFQKLIQEIKNHSINHQHYVVEMYELVNMVFDSGRLRYHSVVKKTDKYSTQKVIDSNFVKAIQDGKGDIQLSAYIPKDVETDLACSIEFRKSEVSGMNIVIGSEALVEDYFVSEEEFSKKHCNPRTVDDDYMYIQIEAVQMKMNALTIRHLYEAFSALHEEYKKSLTCFGAVGFERIDKGFRIMSISEEQHLRLMDYIDNHQYDKCNGEEYIYHTIKADLIHLESNRFMKLPDCIFAKIRFKKGDGVYDVIWEPGYNADTESQEGYDNRYKWKADYTKEYLEGIIA